MHKATHTELSKNKSHDYYYIFFTMTHPDLPELVHARLVLGGLVPQSPSGSGPAVAAGHRLADGPPAEAAGLQQRLPAVPWRHLRYTCASEVTTRA